MGVHAGVQAGGQEGRQGCRQVTVHVLVSVCWQEASKRAGKRMGMLAGVQCMGGAGGTYEELRSGKGLCVWDSMSSAQAPRGHHRISTGMCAAHSAKVHIGTISDCKHS